MEDPSRAKIAAAVAGGYLLGRTKKGKAAIRMMMWLSGNTSGPKVVGAAKQGLNTAAQNEMVSQLVAQFKGPLMEAAQRAAVQMVVSRVGNISQSLADRTSQLNQVAEGVGDQTSEVAKTATKPVKSTARRATKSTTSTATKATKSATGAAKSTTSAAKKAATPAKKAASSTTRATKSTPRKAMAATPSSRTRRGSRAKG